MNVKAAPLTRILSAFLFLCWSLSLLPAARGQGANRLWYRQAAPLDHWTEALPVGNGRIGAMVFGGVAKERIQLNESTLWSDEDKDRKNPGAAKAVPEIRRLLLSGHIGEAEKLAQTNMISIPPKLPNYETLGDLHLEFPDSAPVVSYRRELDLATGVVRIDYSAGGVHYTREIFASAPDEALVIRLSADKPGAISLQATLSRPQDALTQVSGNRLIMTSSPERKGSIRFRTELEVLPQGGQLQGKGDLLSIEKANSVVLILAAGTTMDRKNLEEDCEAELARATKPYEQLRARAIADHAKYFDRLHLQLGHSNEELSRLPTDERLAKAAAGADDPDLYNLYFQFARYLLIASSRPNSPVPANLQGIWNESIHPAWGSKFTININTEMNYWLAQPAALGELDLPVASLLELSKKKGEDVAKTYYGARGFVLHHNTDIYGDAVPIDGYAYGIWPMGAAWMSLQLWEHYAYSGDNTYLAERAYPIMHDAALFFLDTLTPDASGHLVTGPSLSPENRYKLPDGTAHSLTMGPTMDIEIVRALFTRVKQASAILNKDANFRASIEKALTKLPPFKVGKLGQLQEWQEDYDESAPGHRHISHLWALFPGDQIDWRSTPDLTKAAQVTLQRRLDNGGGQTGWSRAWVVNYWARLGDGDKAYDSLQVLLRQSTFPNLFDSHPGNPAPVFQIDGNFGGANGILEMLLQSQNDELYFLPALPKVWDEGNIAGIRGRGGWKIDMSWTKGKLKSATLLATMSLTQRLRAPRGQQILSIERGGKNLPLQKNADGSVNLKASAGSQYIVLFQ